MSLTGLSVHLVFDFNISSIFELFNTFMYYLDERLLRIIKIPNGNSGFLSILDCKPPLSDGFTPSSDQKRKTIKKELEVAGKAAAAALQNTVYQLLSETFSNEYQFGFRYIRKRF